MIVLVAGTLISLVSGPVDSKIMDEKLFFNFKKSKSENNKKVNFIFEFS